MSDRCPFCGGDVFTDRDEDDGKFWAFCGAGCGGSGPYRATDAEAMRAFVTVGLAAGVDLAKRTATLQLGGLLHSRAIDWTECDAELAKLGG